jgi:phosphoribosylanthranilate isomerase
VAADIKFCGLTRAEDASFAVSLGAAYVGVIFAESPRRLEPSTALRVLAPARGRARRVGVFGPTAVEAIAEIASAVSLDAVQLHGDPDSDTVERVRDAVEGEVWAVVRIAGTELPPEATSLLSVADAVVLDTKVTGQLGGTGQSFDWTPVARALDRTRARARIVLAGGLTHENVAHAVSVIAPDVVDVSSGVESAPGIKDHDRMRLFSEAVRRRGNGE